MVVILYGKMKMARALTGSESLVLNLAIAVVFLPSVSFEWTHKKIWGAGQFASGDSPRSRIRLKQLASPDNSLPNINL